MASYCQHSVPAGLITLAMLLWAPLAQSKVCSQYEATAADALIDHIDTWGKVNTMQKRYGHCDDGGIAEGNSEAIARLLIDQWPALPQLNALIKRNPQLKKFVLRHIDDTLDTADLEKIKLLSVTSCPAGAEPLCKAITAAASRPTQ